MAKKKKKAAKKRPKKKVAKKRPKKAAKKRPKKAAKKRPKKKVAKKKVAKKRPKKKPIIQRIGQRKDGTWVLEKVFVPKGKFRRDALVEVKTGKRSTFLSTKQKGVTNVFGCLPKDYRSKVDVCLRLTVQKRIIEISKVEAERLKAKNPQLMIIANPHPKTHPKTRVPTRKKASKHKRPNKCKPKAHKKAKKARTGRPKVKPSLTRVKPRKNLTVSQSDVGRARRAYKRFHFVAPAKVTTGNVPNGYENAYMVIGELERFDVKTPSGETVSRRYTANRPKLCTTANMKDIFVFAGSRLGIPAGKAMRCDYRVPANSGRNKWSRRWWHPHDTHPKVLPHRSGKAVRVTGKGLKVTPRGIEG